MKLNLRHTTYIFLLLISLCTKAQQNLQFVENRGQWDKNIQFKGEMTTGDLVLKPDGGYRILQYDTTNLKELMEKIHPHNEETISKKSENAGVGAGKEPEKADFNFTLKGHVYEIKFLNGNPNPIAIPDKQIQTYNNYFIGKDSSKWAGNCRIFNAVTYKNIYPDIDIRYYTDDKGNLKYDFIINPGGNPSDIIMYLDGADNVSVKKGKLSVKTSVGEVSESIPSCFQFNTITGRKEVGCSYKASGNVVHFDIKGELDKNSTLIIDPQFVFSTFTGSKASNWGYTATYDALGNFYAGGIVFGNGFPVTNGAFETTFQGGNGATGEGGGGFDIGIMKFDPLGTSVLYATYIGGAGNEYPHSLVVDANYNLIISGKTTSSNYPIFPVNLPHYGPGQASDSKFDIILTKLNASGSRLIGSRSIGGTGNDGVNVRNKYTGGFGPISVRQNYGDDSRSEVIVDSFGNIYLASCTQSTDFPTTSNAFQQTHGANTNGSFNQDAVVIKTSPDLSTILFSTYLGGNGDDAAFIVALDPSTNLLAVAGGTTSTNFPGDTNNVINPRFMGGVCDGFITIISNDGSKLFHTSYLGTTGTDVIFGVQYDKLGYPYVMGTTTGNWPTLNASFVQVGGKQFIAKLKKDLSGFIYSTTFGSADATVPNISPTAFLVDRCENVYVSGWGGKGNTLEKYPSSGTIGLPVTINAIKKLTDGSDFYFFVLEHNANSQLYGSFFGQTGGNYPNHVDGGTSRFDKNGVIYQSICANCGGGALFPTTAGVVYPNNGSKGCNLAAVKIAFNLAGVGAAIRSTIKGIQGKVVGCVPLTVNFIDTLGEGSKYIWNFGDNSPKDTTTIPSNSHTYNTVGSYYATVVSVDSSACNITDTSGEVIKVASNEATLGLTATKTGGCQSTTYLFNNTSTASTPFQNNSFTLNFGDGTQQTIGSQSISHSYPSQGTYIVSLVLNDPTYCNAPDSIHLRLGIAQNVKAIINTDSVGCSPYNAVILNNSMGGQTFNWDFGDGTTYAGSDITLKHFYADTGRYVIKLVAIDSSTCNIADSTTFLLVTRSKPTATFTFSPNPPQANQAVVFTNQSSNANKFLWLFADGDSLLTSTTETVSHIFNTSQTYRVNLIAINESGCRDTAKQDIKALVTPFVDVANAIAPNGTNRTVQVRGYGIDKMTWTIYNRWGQVVFQTTNRNDVWDGKYKGQIQPADVYTYTLDVTFTDSQHYIKTGDITLLR